MRPEVDQILLQSLGTLLGEVAPQLGQNYAAGHVTIISMLMLFAAQEYERGADIRAHENAQMRALFRDAGEIVSDENLIRRLNAAGLSRDESLTIAALNAQNDQLKALLIALHEFVEGWNHPQAQPLDSRIWSMLRDFANRRALFLPDL